jgi:outer membrane receptor protein involved in Fe transport
LGKQHFGFDNIITYTNPQQQERLIESYTFNSKPVSVSTAMDYQLSSKSTVGAMVDFQNRHSPRIDIAHDYITDYTNAAPTIDSFYNKSNTSTNTNFVSGNLYYKFEEEKDKRSLELNLDYFNYRNKTNNEFFSYYANNLPDIYNGYQSYVQQKISNYSAKLDYSQTIFKSITLEAGGKYTYTETKNPYDFYNYENGDWINNPGVSNYFIYKEKIAAAYASLEKKFSEKFTAKAGLRLENTNLNNIQLATDDNHGQNYTRVLPTAYLSYKINRSNNLSFSIRNDFNRPPYYALNPFKDYSSNKNLVQGNPFLQPSTSTQYELSYTLKSSYVFMARYTHASSLFSQVQNVIPPDTLSYSYANYGGANTWSLLSVINKSIIKNLWQINLTNSLQWKTLNTDAYNVQLNKTYTIYSMDFSQTFTNLFKSGIDVSVDGMYQSKFAGVASIGKSIGQVGFGASKNFLKPDLKIGIYANDIFKTYIDRSTTVGSAAFQSYLRSDYDLQYIRIYIVKKFGNKKLKKMQSREGGNSNEKARAR